MDEKNIVKAVVKKYRGIAPLFVLIVLKRTIFNRLWIRSKTANQTH